MSIINTLPEVISTLQPQIQEVLRITFQMKNKLLYYLENSDEKYIDLCKSNIVNGIIGIGELRSGIGAIEDLSLQERTNFNLNLTLIPGNFKNPFTPHFLYFIIKDIISKNDVQKAMGILSMFLVDDFEEGMLSINKVSEHRINRDAIAKKSESYPNIESIILDGFNLVEIGNYLIAHHIGYLQECVLKNDAYSSAIYGFYLYLKGDKNHGRSLLESTKEEGNELAQYYLGFIDFLKGGNEWVNILQTLINTPRTFVLGKQLEFEINERNGNSGLARLATALT